MQKSDLPELAKLLMGVWAARGKSVSEPLLEIFTLALNIYDITAIRAAIVSFIRNPDNGQFLPTPADIIRHIDGNSGSQALIAWTKVTQAIKHVGGYSSIVFDDALIHAVISDMGGWITLCRTSSDDLIFRGKEFEKRYSAYAMKRPSHYLRSLMGVFEHNNSCKGYVAAPPQIWGNPAVAKLIYENGHECLPSPSLIVRTIHSISSARITLQELATNKLNHKQEKLEC